MGNIGKLVLRSAFLQLDFTCQFNFTEKAIKNKPRNLRNSNVSKFGPKNYQFCTFHTIYILCKIQNVLSNGEKVEFEIIGWHTANAICGFL